MIWQICILALVLCTSCQRSPWSYHYIKEQSCAWTRLKYCSQDRVQGIDIEFLCQKNTLTTYLQVTTRKIPEVKDFSKQTRITLINREKTYTSLGTLHEGKQRVRLSETSQMYLIEWLKNGQPVTIKLEGYEEEVDPVRFAKLFKKLYQPPYILPFRLPF